MKSTDRKESPSLKKNIETEPVIEIDNSEDELITNLVSAIKAIVESEVKLSMEKQKSESINQISIETLKNRINDIVRGLDAINFEDDSRNDIFEKIKSIKETSNEALRIVGGE